MYSFRKTYEGIARSELQNPEGKMFVYTYGQAELFGKKPMDVFVAVHRFGRSRGTSFEKYGVTKAA